MPAAGERRRVWPRTTVKRREGEGIVKRILALAAVLGLALASATSPAVAQAASAVKKIDLPPDNAMAKLKPGPGVETVETECMICHSTDYIVRQPGGDAKHWEPEVRKMIAVYGAPISEADVQTVVACLQVGKIDDGLSQLALSAARQQPRQKVVAGGPVQD